VGGKTLWYSFIQTIKVLLALSKWEEVETSKSTCAFAGSRPLLWPPTFFTLFICRVCSKLGWCNLSWWDWVIWVSPYTSHAPWGAYTFHSIICQGCWKSQAFLDYWWNESILPLFVTSSFTDAHISLIHSSMDSYTHCYKLLFMVQWFVIQCFQPSQYW
jgi:hypothetical protein